MLHNLKSIPGGVDAVVIATRPQLAEATVRECADLGIKHVWMHRAFGSYVGLVCAVGVAYGGMVRSREPEPTAEG